VARQKRRSHPCLPRRSLHPGSRRWPVCRRSVQSTSMRTGNLALRRQVTLKARMGGRKARSVRRCLLRPLHRPARRKRQDAANVPCEGNVQCQDGSLTLYAGAKSPGVDRESNWLPVARSRFTFAPTGRGAPSSMVSGDRRLSSEYNSAVNYGVRDVVPRCERVGPTRTSGEVRYCAAIRGTADLIHAP
jgi:hypothetical protein